MGGARLGRLSKTSASDRTSAARLTGILTGCKAIRRFTFQSPPARLTTASTSENSAKSAVATTAKVVKTAAS